MILIGCRVLLARVQERIDRLLLKLGIAPRIGGTLSHQFRTLCFDKVVTGLNGQLVISKLSSQLIICPLRGMHTRWPRVHVHLEGLASPDNLICISPIYSSLEVTLEHHKTNKYRKG